MGVGAGLLESGRHRCELQFSLIDHMMLERLTVLLEPWFPLSEIVMMILHILELL